MRGMISTYHEQGSRGVKFYRLMSLVGISVSLLYILVFVVMVQDGTEYIWDRVIILVASIIGYAVSFHKSINRKRYYIYINILFYAFVSQIIFDNALNNFGFLYLISLYVTLQAISISFKNTKQVIWFLTYSIGFSIVAIYINNSLSLLEKNFLSATLAVSAILLYFIVKLKSRFQGQLQIHQNLLQTIVTKTEESILISDFEGDIFDANDVAEKMFGYELNEIVGQNFRKLRRRDLTDQEDRIGVEALLKDRFWNDEVELKRKDGSIFIGFVSIGWVRKKGTEFLIYRVKNITHKKEAEKQLIQAKEKAEEAANAKSVFMATMSHEIRTPMNGVLGMTKLLLKTKMSKKQKDYLEIIHRSGDNLMTIMNDVLDFSKIEAGKLKLDEHDFDLFTVLADTIAMYEPQAITKSNSIALKIGPDVPKMVFGDSLRLKQVLVNLINNAIKFTNDGSVHVFADLVKDKGHSASIKFQVVDTGVGIPEDKIDKLFESFSQVDSSTTRQYGGTGLGLAICKQLTQLMGGDINVESEEGKGSNFNFILNYKKVQIQELESMTPEVSQENQFESLDISNLEVLLVEDNKINQQVALLILKGLGIQPDMVENGLEAVNAFKDKSYDLIFMDIQMPMMDGIEATQIILKDLSEQGKQPYIVAMTANAMTNDRIKYLDNGMEGFVSKPILIPELKKEIANSLKKIKTNS